MKKRIKELRLLRGDNVQTEGNIAAQTQHLQGKTGAKPDGALGSGHK